MPTVIIALAQSRKAWIFLLAVIGAVAMNLAGRIDSEKALDFVKWVVGFWMASQAWEDGKKHEAGGSNTPSSPPPSETPPP